jgi:hypothetical protein
VGRRRQVMPLDLVDRLCGAGRARAVAAGLRRVDCRSRRSCSAHGVLVVRRPCLRAVTRSRCPTGVDEFPRRPPREHRHQRPHRPPRGGHVVRVLRGKPRSAGRSQKVVNIRRPEDLGARGGRHTYSQLRRGRRHGGWSGPGHRRDRAVGGPATGRGRDTARPSWRAGRQRLGVVIDVEARRLVGSPSSAAILARVVGGAGSPRGVSAWSSGAVGAEEAPHQSGWFSSMRLPEGPGGTAPGAGHVLHLHAGGLQLGHGGVGSSTRRARCWPRSMVADGISMVDLMVAGWIRPGKPKSGRSAPVKPSG